MRILVSQAGVTGEGIVNNMKTVLEMFWKEEDPGFVLPSQGQDGLERAGKNLCVSGTPWAVNQRD